MIWTTPAERGAILEKIRTQPWARAQLDAMRQRVRGEVARHQADRDAYLRGLPLVPDADDPAAHPAFARIDRNMTTLSPARRANQLQRHVLVAVDCAILHFLLDERSYAECAADILQAVVRGLGRMEPSAERFNGGWIYPRDHLFEARALGAQIPLIYDFLAPHLRSGAPVYDLASRELGPFDFAAAQHVFRTYARLAFEHGIIDTNWPVLEMPSLVHNLLALDDPVERSAGLARALRENGSHQDSLAKVVVEYAHAGAVWPESLQYSSGVSALTNYLVTLLRRQSPPVPLPEGYRNIPLSLRRLRDFTFPNGENVRFGDGPRQSSESFDAYEIAYALGERENDDELRRTFGGLLARGLASGAHERGRAENYRLTPNIYLDPLGLLWGMPVVSAPPAAGERPAVTDVLPFAGLVLQRNLAPDGDPRHGLMAAVSGAHYVHAHASGMSLELYGAGQVLGTPAGKGTYTTEEHENYRRLFAAHNAVIVNGASRSAGGWVNLGIATVEPVALEPAARRPAVSPRHSFTVTRWRDDRGEGAEAEQERTVGIVRTSDRGGYYVDVFRSRSALSRQFHDYLYHNLGDSLALHDPAGELALAAQPDRFPPVPGAVWQHNKTYLFPGWHVFKDVRASASTPTPVTAEFIARSLRPAAAMRLHLPGEAGREYATAWAPATTEAPDGYDERPTPILVVRQEGEAWDRPFAVIYEPRTEPASARDGLTAVEALRAGGLFAGFKVTGRRVGQAFTHLVLLPPAATGTFAEPDLGLDFTGRYAVVALDGQGAVEELYVGEGTSLRCAGIGIAFDGPVAGAAHADLRGTVPQFRANERATLRLPDGRVLAAEPTL